jgi:hypothetical protein
MPRGRTERTQDLLAACVEVLEGIQPCSVRAVCYQLFVRRLIPSMARTHTNRISFLLARAREDGHVPWEWIVDETRRPERASVWADPLSFAKAVQRSYRRDRWRQQHQQVEVWSEKGTVRGTLGPVLDELAVTFRVLHGHSSATVLNDVAEETQGLDPPLKVFYVGDHDPSGMDMSERDLPTRLQEYGARVDLERVAVTLADTLGGTVPGFSVWDKTRDTRLRWYVARFGQQCWELDAVNPNVLRDKVRDAIELLIDRDEWDRCEAVERAESQSLEEVMGAWSRLSHGKP